METKKYSSFEQIDLELKILKLEKELSFQKLIWNVQKVKESFTPIKLVRDFFSSDKLNLSNLYRTMLKITLPFIIKWLSNKKRGD